MRNVAVGVAEEHGRSSTVVSYCLASALLLPLPIILASRPPATKPRPLVEETAIRSDRGASVQRRGLPSSIHREWVRRHGLSAKARPGHLVASSTRLEDGGLAISRNRSHTGAGSRRPSWWVSFAKSLRLVRSVPLIPHHSRAHESLGSTAVRCRCLRRFGCPGGHTRLYRVDRLDVRAAGRTRDDAAARVRQGRQLLGLAILADSDRRLAAR